MNINSIEETIKEIQSGNRRLTSRFITACENSYEFLKKTASYIFPMTGKISSTGFAGSFGVGKSTLLDGLIKSARRENFKIGVIAVDPESPFSGGAILGDRIRMNSHFTDEGVFIRSISSRSESVTPEVIVISRILELWGADMVFIETAGLGQTQTEISSVADRVVLLLQPQAGDDIQIMKAGIMEIADLIVITKCDILEPHSLKLSLMGEFGDKVIDYHHRGQCKTPEVSDKEAGKIKIFETGLNLPGSYDILFEELKNFKWKNRRDAFANTVRWLMIKRFRDELDKRFLSERKFEKLLTGNSDPFDIADELFGEVINKEW